MAPSRLVALNRAVTIAMIDGPAAGLALIDSLTGLDPYHLLHAARADLLRQLGRPTEAATAYRRALDLVGNDPESTFLSRRLESLHNTSPDLEP